MVAEKKRLPRKHMVQEYEGSNSLKCFDDQLKKILGLKNGATRLGYGIFCTNKDDNHIIQITVAGANIMNMGD